MATGPDPKPLTMGETPKPTAQPLTMGETPKPPAQPLTMGETPKPTAQPAQPAGDLALATRPKLERARRYRVIFYNDDYTTKWFVVDVLERFFHMTEANAMAFMLVVHETGRGVAGIFTRDVAETKVAEVHEHAKEWEMPLRLDIEPEDD